MVSLPATLRPLISIPDRLAVLVVVGVAHAVVLGSSIRIPPVEPEPGLREIGVVSSEELGLDEPEEVRDVPTVLPTEQPVLQQEAKAEPVESKVVETPKTPVGGDRPVARPEPVEEKAEEKKAEDIREAKAVTPEPAEQASQPLAEKPKPAVSREMLVQYAVLASVAINRMKFYPGDARSKGNTGIVEVAFVIDASGAVIDKRVVKSSGSKALDEAALRMVATAELPPPPNGRFRGRITINFRIKK